MVLTTRLQTPAEPVDEGYTTDRTKVEEKARQLLQAQQDDQISSLRQALQNSACLGSRFQNSTRKTGAWNYSTRRGSRSPTGVSQSEHCYEDRPLQTSIQPVKESHIAREAKDGVMKSHNRYPT